MIAESAGFSHGEFVNLEDESCGSQTSIWKDGDEQLGGAQGERYFFCRCHVNHLLSKEEADHQTNCAYFIIRLLRRQEKF